MPCLITRAGFGETNAFEQVTQGLIWTAVLEGGAEPPSMFVEPEPGISPPPKKTLVWYWPSSGPLGIYVVLFTLE